jgi:hypothetical protein
MVKSDPRAWLFKIEQAQAQAAAGVANAAARVQKETARVRAVRTSWVRRMPPVDVKPASFVLVFAALIVSCTVEAAPIRVRLIEGNFRGFLVLRSLDGTPIAYGEESQRPAGKVIECRTTLRFKDGSLYDELTTFSQNGVLRLEAYRLVQRGPSFPTSEVAFDRVSGRYTARTQGTKDGAVKAASGTLEMPADLYNGMELVVLKNLPGGAGTTVHVAAFTPEPRLLEMEWSADGEDEVLLGGRAMKAMRSLVKLKIGGLTGVIASLVGKSPPDLRYWLVAGDVPAFVRFEGSMFLNGPVWRLEMATVEWPR